MSETDQVGSPKRTLLDAEIAEYRISNPARSEIIQLLCSDKPAAHKIRGWFKKHAREGVAALGAHSTMCAQEVTCTDWQYEISQLAWMMTGNPAPTPWDKAENKVRSRRLNRIAKLARELADALEESPNPAYPPALVLFDEDRALDLAKAMGERTLEYVSGKNCVIPDGITWHPSSRLSNFFEYPEPQQLPPMLRRLAVFAEHPLRKRRTEARPNTGAPEARIFARNLAEYFVNTYGSPWNEIIACCVELKFPDLIRDNPPTADTIRDWRKAK